MLFVRVLTSIDLYSAKIADMGLSLRLEQDRSSFHLTSPGGGSTGWHAPELMRLDPDIRLTRSVDIFSIGCVIYYVLTRGLHPFGERFCVQICAAFFVSILAVSSVIRTFFLGVTTWTGFDI